MLTSSILKQNDEIKYKVTKLVMRPDIIIDGVYQVNWVGCMILFNYSLFSKETNCFMWTRGHILSFKSETIF